MENIFSFEQSPITFSIPAIESTPLGNFLYRWSRDQALQEALTSLISPSLSDRDSYLGWIDLPEEFPEKEIQTIEKLAQSMRSTCSHILCIGIGGSYLGARAVIEGLSSPNLQPSRANTPPILFAGHNLSSDYLHALASLLAGQSFGIVYISKSGTTTEPAIAFRLFRELLEKNIGKEAAARQIVCITDPEKGTLRKLSDQKNYTRLEIPRNIGGRFSVLTPAGLLPIALAGFDIRSLIQGAREIRSHLQNPSSLSEKSNIAALYAYLRKALYTEGKRIEIFSTFTPQLSSWGEWLKQLFGESEGKEEQGVFPATAVFTTDLHSMGQWIQDGERTLFETFIQVRRPHKSMPIPFDKEDTDHLNYLSHLSVEEINSTAETATIQAHLQGGVPVLVISIETLSERTLGALIYFFEFSVAVSGYLFGINPFDQPGVEAYKNNMFRLLNKPQQP